MKRNKSVKEKQENISKEETTKKLSELDEKLKKQKVAIKEILKRLKEEETKNK